MKNFTVNVFLLITFLSLLSCSNIRDSLTFQKKQNIDEFLVKKKAPLTIPPNFEELPLPDNEISEKSDSDVKSLLLPNKKTLTSKQNKISKNSSIEESILDKIEN